MSASIMINGRMIGPKQPVYIIAELSANHGQDFEQAVKTHNAAKEAGADAINSDLYLGYHDHRL